jgi:hypothetical protein
MFSVALSVGSPLPRVTRHTALWSSDFPRSAVTDRDCLADSDPAILPASSWRLKGGLQFRRSRYSSKALRQQAAASQGASKLAHSTGASLECGSLLPP